MGGPESLAMTAPHVWHSFAKILAPHSGLESKVRAKGEVRVLVKSEAHAEVKVKEG